MKARIEFIVYIIGVFLFGLVYANFKAMLGGKFLFAFVAIAYLLVLRLIGIAVRRYFERREPS